MKNAAKTKKVAVIAVHGVGDQAPHETAHRIGDLLQDLNVDQQPNKKPPRARKQAPVYYAFHEEIIRLDVRPTVVQHHQQPAEKETHGPFNTWVEDSLRQGRNVDEDEVWYEFTKGQLSHYCGDDPEDTYCTVRMEGRRASQPGQPAVDVHAYELYWADLSRLKAGMLSVFTELYQLLFHLPSLGVHTVNSAALHHRSTDWQIFRKLQMCTAGALTVVIPILNLFMFGTIATVVVLTAVTAAKAELALATSGLSIMLILVLAWLLWRRLPGQQLKTWTWLSPLLFVIGVIVGVYFTTPKVPAKWDQPLQIVATCIVAIIISLLLFLVLRIYNCRRPGVLKWAINLTILVFAAGVISVYCVPPDPDQRRQVIMFWARQFEISDIALLLAWGGFFILGVGTFVMGATAVIRSRKTDSLAHRSWWTGLLLLSLPALAFLIVTVCVWYLVADYVPRFLPDANYQALWESRFGTRCLKAIPHILQEHLGIVFDILMCGAAGSTVFAIWGLGPIVWTEIFPPKPARNWNDKSKASGRWLTLGFHGLFFSGVILYVATMFLLPLSSLSIFFKGWGAVSNITGLHVATYVSSTGFVGLFLARKRLRKLALGFRPVLDILLDVDNWFREHPRTSNPKARIFGRYVSLLRYICNWREDSTDEKSGYDGIVIIAHSQGAVITADLLRFLKRESKGNLVRYDPELQKLNAVEIPIHFFTVGSPLRQLYGLRFPHLYQWARHDDQREMNSWNARDIPTDQLPNPGDLLGVKLWVNCFRSGDYVGRSLWRTDSCDYLWTPDLCGHPPAHPAKHNSTDGAQRLEFCIGPGAHTHYWDRTARIVANELDRLISTL